MYQGEQREDDVSVSGGDPPVQHVGDIIRNASVFCQWRGWWPVSGWLLEFGRRGLAVFEHRPQTWQAVST